VIKGSENIAKKNTEINEKLKKRMLLLKKYFI